MKNTKAVLIIIISMMALLLAACQQKSMDGYKDNGQGETQQSETQQSETQQSETQPSILYVNEKLGFSIEFPKSWEGLYGVSENYVELNSWGAAGIIAYQKASHDTGTTNATGRLFNISRWIGTWTSENSPVMSGYSAVVLQTDKYTYMLHTPSGVEYNENDPAAIAEYKEMCESLDIIAASVKSVDTYSPIQNTPANSKYRTELDFLDSQEGKQICADSYGVAKAILEVNSDELANYLIDPNQTSSILRNTSNVFGDLIWFVFKFNLDSIISEDEIRTSYEYALAGDDSYTYISMTFKKVNGEWKVSSIGKEK